MTQDDITNLISVDDGSLFLTLCDSYTILPFYSLVLLLFISNPNHL